MQKPRFLLLLVSSLLLNACLPGGGRNITPTPTFTPSFTASATSSLTPTLTPTGEAGYIQCAWNWATEALPDLSVEVQAAVENAGLMGVVARAEAFGENCITEDGRVDRFAVMETDFRIWVTVASLTDTAALGDILERLLLVLDHFPPSETPGPQPGYIGITYTDNQAEQNLWFTVTEGESARGLGLHGAELFSELSKR